MSWPRVLVCAGGGGVGKTSTSAAIALAAARRGERVLVVTIDPARRLADALGVALGPSVQAVETSEQSAGASGELLALMPDPRQSMRTFVEYLFAGRPKALERVVGGLLAMAQDTEAWPHGIIDADVALLSLEGLGIAVSAAAQERRSRGRCKSRGRVRCLIG